MMNELQIDEELKNRYIDLGMNINNKHFRMQYLAGNLNLETISDEYINNIKNYYKQFTDKKINLKNHIVIKNLTGIEDVRIIPREILRQDLIPLFNDRGMINTFTDKNFYEILFQEFNQPVTVLKNVRGQFFTNKNKHLSYSEAKDTLLNSFSEYIIKSSDVENGESVNKIIVNNNKITMNDINYTFSQLVEHYKSNFLIQKVIKQHPTMAKLHPYSVNTLRIVTLRWNNKINHIYTFCRFGTDKDIKDNAGQGGVVVGVKDNGEFMSLASNRTHKFDKHPTTQVPIRDLDKIPNYDKCIALAKRMHKKILHQDFVSWDIAIEENGEPIFIEANFFGSAIVNQIALERPIFGDLTDEILHKACTSDNHNTNTQYSKMAEKYINSKKNVRKYKRRYRNINKRYKETKNELKKTKRLLKKQKKHNNNMKVTVTSLQKEIQNIKNSRSWRYTSFLRRKK